MKQVDTESIHSGAFERFGQLLSETSDTPLADSLEMTYWGGIAKFDFPQNLSSGYLQSRNTSREVKQLERHTKTGEILVALDSDVVICMATPDSEIGKGREDVAGFHVRRGEAIKMHPGTWHWLPIPVDSNEAHLLVLFAENTESDDLEIVELSEPVSLTEP